MRPEDRRVGQANPPSWRQSTQATADFVGDRPLVEQEIARKQQRDKDAAQRMHDKRSDRACAPLEQIQIVHPKLSRPGFADGTAFFGLRLQTSCVQPKKPNGGARIQVYGKSAWQMKLEIRSCS